MRLAVGRRLVHIVGVDDTQEDVRFSHPLSWDLLLCIQVVLEEDVAKVQSRLNPVCLIFVSNTVFILEELLLPDIRIQRASCTPELLECSAG